MTDTSWPTDIKSVRRMSLTLAPNGYEIIIEDIKTKPNGEELKLKQTGMATHTDRNGRDLDGNQTLMIEFSKLLNEYHNRYPIEEMRLSYVGDIETVVLGCKND